MVVGRAGAGGPFRPPLPVSCANRGIARRDRYHRPGLLQAKSNIFSNVRPPLVFSLLFATILISLSACNMGMMRCLENRLVIVSAWGHAMCRALSTPRAKPHSNAEHQPPFSRHTNGLKHYPDNPQPLAPPHPVTPNAASCHLRLYPVTPHTYPSICLPAPSRSPPLLPTPVSPRAPAEPRPACCSHAAHDSAPQSPRHTPDKRTSASPRRTR